MSKFDIILTFHDIRQDSIQMGPIMASKQKEIDVIESWEDIDETDALEENFRKMIVPDRSLDSRSNGDLSSNRTPMNDIIITGEDALRSQYVPPEPTVKILKRPSTDTHCNSDSKVFQPKKTLQQREQEYAEARLRILGEANPEPVEEKICIQNKPRPVELENVIRMPKGPDGTKGFNIRR